MHTCKRIDIHTHILPKQLPNLSQKYGYGGWISTKPLENGNQMMLLDDKPFREIGCECWDPEKRLEPNRIQVLSTIPVLFNYWAKPEHCLDLAKYLNDDIAMTCQQYPTKFIGLATLPMQDPDLAVKELHRCVNELGLKGIQIGSHINDWNLDQKELYPIWQACEDLDVPVFIHPWDMDQGTRMKKYWFPWLIGMPCETTIAICSLIFGGVLEKFKKIRFCFAHAGGSFPYTLGRIEHGFHCRPDLVQTDCNVKPSDYLGRFWCDSLIHDEDGLELLIKKMGINRILLGSDYPFPLGELEAGKMVYESSRLTDEEKFKILFGNAFEFFGPRVNKSIYEQGS